MRVETHNTKPSIDTNGTCLQGYVDCSYNDLVALFGEPLGGDGYKVQAEWNLEFEDGEVATIYDWKEELPPQRVRDWHVGGRHKIAAARVNQIIASRHLPGRVEVPALGYVA
jgi:hypothetical protein